MSIPADLKEFGAALRLRRKELGLTQEMLAALAGCGVVFVAQLEGGKPTLRFHKVLDVLAVLGMQLRLAVAPPEAAVTIAIPSHARGGEDEV